VNYLEDPSRGTGIRHGEIAKYRIGKLYREQRIETNIIFETRHSVTSARIKDGSRVVDGRCNDRTRTDVGLIAVIMARFDFVHDLS